MSYPYLLQHLLERSADRHPDRAAVVDAGRTTTYRQLESESNRLARLLHELGVSKDDRVGIHMDKSSEAVTAVYGILKAGATYVPLDPRSPAARLAYIARDCDIRCLVTATGKLASWGEPAAEGSALRALVVLDSQGPVEPPRGLKAATARDLRDMDNSAHSVGTVDVDLAYILYTSGSTGAPKGVMLSHRNGLAFVEWTVDEFGVGPDDRLSSHAPFHFDLSIFDLFGASMSGASVSLVPPRISVFPIEVARFIESHQITIWYSVPSILTLLTEHGNLREGDLSSLRTILFAGEVFPTKYLSRLMRLLPQAEFANLYGPTETNVCTYYRVPEPPDEQAGDIAIGRPIANVDTFVVRDDGTRAEPGEVGELLVRGSTVMRGYWGDPDKTAQRLVSSPLWGPDSAYRTGDLVSEAPDGNYQFLGRKDHQIKSRGYRIELGEIESVLYAHPAVVECVVIPIPDEMISNRIKAYVAARGDLSEGELAGFCAGRLPKYMIPEHFAFREELPKTSTGKIDRQSLVALEQPARSGG